MHECQRFRAGLACTCGQGLAGLGSKAREIGVQSTSYIFVMSFRVESCCDRKLAPQPQNQELSTTGVQRTQKIVDGHCFSLGPIVQASVANCVTHCFNVLLLAASGALEDVRPRRVGVCFHVRCFQGQCNL